MFRFQGRQIGGPAAIGLGRVNDTTRFLLGTSGTSVANNDTPASNNHRGFAFFQFQLRQGNFAQADGYAAPGVAHSMPAGMPSQKITGIRAEKTCTEYFIVSTR